MEINEARLSSLPVILKLSGKEVVLDELAAGQLQHELQARPHQVAKILHIWEVWSIFSNFSVTFYWNSFLNLGLAGSKIPKIVGKKYGSFSPKIMYVEDFF